MNQACVDSTVSATLDDKWKCWFGTPVFCILTEYLVLGGDNRILQTFDKLCGVSEEEVAEDGVS